jgi:LysM repeat protein
MPIRRPARVLAPLVLLACAAAVLLIIQRTLAEDTTDPLPKATQTQTQTTTTPRRRSYTVKSGDTLGGIAERQGISVDALLELNPKVDPQSLRAGQRLKLRE